MYEKDISQYILDTFVGVEVVTANGNSFFFYDPENKVPFVTIVVNDEYDNASDLNREGVYRLNIGVSKQTYQTMFRTEDAHGVEIRHTEGYDLTALDTLMPHPVYGRMYWVCVLNPSEATFEKVRPLLKEAYDIAVRKFERLAQARNQ